MIVAICKTCLTENFDNVLIETPYIQKTCLLCQENKECVEVDYNYLSPKIGFKANKFISKIKRKMKIKSNVPYYEKMKAKLDAEIKKLEEARAVKVSERDSIQGVIDNLKKVEGTPTVTEKAEESQPA